MAVHFDTLLGVLKGADMNSTADQAIAMLPSKYVITSIVVVNASASLTAAVGGFYDAASKGGNVLGAAIQAYSALTGSTKFLNPTLAVFALGTILTAATIYLSLTVAQGGAATADVYVFGYALP